GRGGAGRRAERGKVPPGPLWRWELEPVDASRTRVTHTYDWTRLTDEGRLPRARATTADRLRASLDRLPAPAGGAWPSARGSGRLVDVDDRAVGEAPGLGEVQPQGPGQVLEQ